MAEGAPVAADGAHLHPDLDRPGGAVEPLPPGHGLTPGGIERFVEIVKHGVGRPFAVDEAVLAQLGGARRRMAALVMPGLGHGCHAT